MSSLESMKSTQADGDNTPNLSVGTITEPGWLWAALAAIGKARPTRNGVLLIHSQDCRGRLGIFCNRYISGGVIDGRNQTGLEAVRTLLSAKSGVFGYRACMGTETTELKQHLCVDVQTLLSARPDRSLRSITTPGDLLQAAPDASMVQFPEALLHAGQSDESLCDVPVFSAQAVAESSADGTTAIDRYGQLVQDEIAKVSEQLEKSQAAPEEEADRVKLMEDLRNFMDLLHDEQERAQGWRQSAEHAIIARGPNTVSDNAITRPGSNDLVSMVVPAYMPETKVAEANQAKPRANIAVFITILVLAGALAYYFLCLAK